MFRVLRSKVGRIFSAVQTAWRRGRDSNPRYSFVTLSLDVSVGCRLQKYRQRISPPKTLPELAIGPISIRRPFANLRRTLGDSVAEIGHFLRPRTYLGSQLTACLAGSRKVAIFIFGEKKLSKSRKDRFFELGKTKTGEEKPSPVFSKTQLAFDATAVRRHTRSHSSCRRQKPFRSRRKAK